MKTNLLVIQKPLLSTVLKIQAIGPLGLCVEPLSQKIIITKPPSKFSQNAPQMLETKQGCPAGCKQTLPDATPLTYIIHQLSKIAVTFQPVERF